MKTEELNSISWNDFKKIEIRVGTIIFAEDFIQTKKPALKLKIDFGKFGIKKSSAQITRLYSLNELIGKQVVAVVNFPPKQIANYMSECLVLGAVEDFNMVTLITSDKKVENGTRIA